MLAIPTNFTRINCPVHAPMSNHSLIRAVCLFGLSLFALAIGQAFATEDLRLKPDAGPVSTEASFHVPRDVIQLDDIPYSQIEGQTLKLNIIRPKQTDTVPRPVIVWIHGGGWHAGNRYSGLVQCSYMAQRGYVCASIDYRLSQDAVWPAQIDDCRLAIRFLKANAAKFGIDSSRIGVWGESAGGHLASLLGTSGCEADRSAIAPRPKSGSTVQAVCDWYGPTNIAAMGSQGSDLNPDDPLSAPALLFGSGGLSKHANAVRAADPCTYASRYSAPFLIVHGESDTSVPLAQSVMLADSLRRQGGSVEFVVLEGARHADPAFLSPNVLQVCGAFFDRYLKTKSASKQ